MSNDEKKKRWEVWNAQARRGNRVCECCRTLDNGLGGVHETLVNVMLFVGIGVGQMMAYVVAVGPMEIVDPSKVRFGALESFAIS
jgi:hypothetical protein